MPTNVSFKLAALRMSQRVACYGACSRQSLHISSLAFSISHAATRLQGHSHKQGVSVGAQKGDSVKHSFDAGSLEKVAKVLGRTVQPRGKKLIAERKESHKTGRKEVPYKSPIVDTEDLLSFEKKGHLTLRRLLEKKVVLDVSEAIEDEVEANRLEALRHRVRVLCPGVDAARLTTVSAAEQQLKAHATERVGFLQLFNTWRRARVIQELVCKGPLAEVAAGLLSSRLIRVYQDCAFLKEPGHGQTNWHSDLRMAPLDTNQFVTAWIPLRKMKAKSDSGLRFASGSHRDFALAFWHRGRLEHLDLSSRGYPIEHIGAMELGDVSWHSGWTLHSAAAQPLGSASRLALSISYFADGACVLPQKLAGQVQGEDRESYEPWLKDIKWGSPAAHKLLPLIDAEGLQV